MQICSKVTQSIFVFPKQKLYFLFLSISLYIRYRFLGRISCEQKTYYAMACREVLSFRHVNHSFEYVFSMFFLAWIYNVRALSRLFLNCSHFRFPACFFLPAPHNYNQYVLYSFFLSCILHTFCDLCIYVFSNFRVLMQRIFRIILNPKIMV